MDNFINSINSDDIPDVNKYINDLIEDEEKLKLIHKGIPEILKLQNLIKNRNFKWELINENLVPGEILSTKIKLWLYDLFENIDFNYCQIINFEQFFDKLFPVKFIISVFKNSNYSFGKQIYDETLRFQSKLFYYFIKLKIKNKIRNLNKIFYDINYLITDYKDIFEFNKLKFIEIEKYLDIKLIDFIYILIEKYFPNVGWRWIGNYHYMHCYTLHLIKILYEYNYLDIENTEIIIDKLVSIIEVLINLENNIIKDLSRLSVTFLNSLYISCRKNKKYIIEILNYILIQYNYHKKEIKEELIFIFVNYILDDKQFIKKKNLIDSKLFKSTKILINNFNKNIIISFNLEYNTKLNYDEIENLIVEKNKLIDLIKNENNNELIKNQIINIFKKTNEFFLLDDNENKFYYFIKNEVFYCISDIYLKLEDNNYILDYLLFIISKIMNIKDANLLIIIIRDNNFKKILNFLIENKQLQLYKIIEKKIYLLEKYGYSFNYLDNYLDITNKIYKYIKEKLEIKDKINACLNKIDKLNDHLISNEKELKKFTENYKNENDVKIENNEDYKKLNKNIIKYEDDLNKEIINLDNYENNLKNNKLKKISINYLSTLKVINNIIYNYFKNSETCLYDKVSIFFINKIHEILNNLFVKDNDYDKLNYDEKKEKINYKGFLVFNILKIINIILLKNYTPFEIKWNENIKLEKILLMEINPIKIELIKYFNLTICGYDNYVFDRFKFNRKEGYNFMENRLNLDNISFGTVKQYLEKEFEFIKNNSLKYDDMFNDYIFECYLPLIFKFYSAIFFHSVEKYNLESYKELFYNLFNFLKKIIIKGNIKNRINLEEYNNINENFIYENILKPISELYNESKYDYTLYINSFKKTFEDKIEINQNNNKYLNFFTKLLKFIKNKNFIKVNNCYNLIILIDNNNMELLYDTKYNKFQNILLNLDNLLENLEIFQSIYILFDFNKIIKEFNRIPDFLLFYFDILCDSLKLCFYKLFHDNIFDKIKNLYIFMHYFFIQLLRKSDIYDNGYVIKFIKNNFKYYNNKCPFFNLYILMECGGNYVNIYEKIPYNNNYLACNTLYLTYNIDLISEFLINDKFLVDMIYKYRIDFWSKLSGSLKNNKNNLKFIKYNIFYLKSITEFIKNIIYYGDEQALKKYSLYLKPKDIFYEIINIYNYYYKNNTFYEKYKLENIIINLFSIFKKIEKFDYNFYQFKKILKNHNNSNEILKLDNVNNNYKDENLYNLFKNKKLIEIDFENRKYLLKQTGNQIIDKNKIFEVESKNDLIEIINNENNEENKIDFKILRFLDIIILIIFLFFKYFFKYNYSIFNIILINLTIWVDRNYNLNFEKSKIFFVNICLLLKLNYGLLLWVWVQFYLIIYKKIKNYDFYGLLLIVLLIYIINNLLIVAYEIKFDFILLLVYLILAIKLIFKLFKNKEIINFNKKQQQKLKIIEFYKFNVLNKLESNRQVNKFINILSKKINFNKIINNLIN